jgi:hypothetical protein
LPEPTAHPVISPQIEKSLSMQQEQGRTIDSVLIGFSNNYKTPVYQGARTSTKSRH